VCCRWRVDYLDWSQSGGTDPFEQALAGAEKDRCDVEYQFVDRFRRQVVAGQTTGAWSSSNPRSRRAGRRGDGTDEDAV